MDNRPTLPIKIKIMGLTTVILIASLAFYTYYASNLFTSDKKAYIYETSLATATGIANEIDNLTLTYLKDLEVFKQLSEIKRDHVIKQLLERTDEKVFFYHFKKGKLQKVSTNKSLLKKLKINEHIFETKILPHLKKINNVVAPTLETIATDNLIFLNLRFNDSGLIFFSEQFEKVLDNNRIYKSQIFNDKNIPLGKERLSEEITESLKDNLELSSVVNTIDIKNEKSLFAVVKTKTLPLKVVSLISYDKAFLVTTHLKRKSLLFAVFILAVSGVFVVLFSRSLSNPIEKLYNASTEIAKGNFDLEVSLKSNDEIGHLGKSFNYMTKRIRHFIEEMKEKARLENEVTIAKTVQEEFFPEPLIELNNYRLSSLTHPASECGGDWWGFHENEDLLITMVADATGHGLPAALLTSAINSTFISIKGLIDSGKMEAKPEEILSFINNNIHHIGTKILLTAFICIFDKKTQKMSYSNASHIDALIIPKKDSITKEDIRPLIGAKGPRLGHKLDSAYSHDTIDINLGDKIILLTDGILECENTDGKQWGTRRLIKTIITSNEQKSDLTTAISQSVDEHRGTKAFDDDITIITAEVLG